MFAEISFWLIAATLVGCLIVATPVLGVLALVAGTATAATAGRGSGR